MAAIASGPDPNPLDDLIDNHVESYAFQAHVEALSTHKSSLNVAFGQEQGCEFDTAMEIQPEIEANLCKVDRCMVGSRTNNKMIVCLDLSSEWDFGGYSDFDLETVNRLSPATITKQNPSFGTTGSLGPQSGGQRLSPFSQFINLEIFDTRPGFQLITNLPWFRLQSMLEQPGVNNPGFSSLFPDTNHGFKNTYPYSYVLC
jgi:hypothetical protein